MPDPLRQTISATQSPGLFNVSPYVTRWMLYQHFANGIAIDEPEDARMSWGKKLQPLVLAQAAEDMRLEVRPNQDDAYLRHGRLGCTRDGEIVCPDRGPGAVETKCVFDYATWMTEWHGGRAPPRRHEIQLQQQMYVGDGKTPYRWGLLVAWVAGEQKYFERAPNAEFWTMLEGEAAAFFAEVEGKREPDPFGVPVESDLIKQLFPIEKGKVLDLSADPAADAHADMVSLYKHHAGEKSAHEGETQKLRAQILALAKDNEEVLLPGRVKIRLTDAGNGRRITVYVPDPLATAAPQNLLLAG